MEQFIVLHPRQIRAKHTVEKCLCCLSSLSLVLWILVDILSKVKTYFSEKKFVTIICTSSELILRQFLKTEYLFISHLFILLVIFDRGAILWRILCVYIKYIKIICWASLIEHFLI